MYELKDAPKNLYHLMEKSLKRGSLMGCAVEVLSYAYVELISK